MNQPKTLLIVEDQPFQRRALVRQLKALDGWRILEATDGQAALGILENSPERVDAIVTDLDMPNMDGIALIRRLGDAAPDAGVVLLSALDRSVLTTVETLARDQRLNLLGILEKPADPAALHNLLCRPIPSRAPTRMQSLPTFSLDEIDNAVRVGQFEAFVQPQATLADGVFAGCEALARWRHPEFGIVAPAAFIEKIEVSASIPLIETFTLAILNDVAKVASQLQAAGLPGRVAINVPFLWLDQPETAERLAQAVARLGLPAERFTIEVTESSASRNAANALENLARLRMRGFGLSIDDFGTGFSSLERLTHVPFTELKLDRGFITGLQPNSPRWAIVESTIAMAAKLRLVTIAEGVETRAEWNNLAGLGCELVQGYHFAKPMSIGDFQTWLRQHGLNRQMAAGSSR
jgi:EAL domain-containing protein (putative c-di-GMP-specific phosphodiesterase class I)/ActR/RegA family two-component response regulator